MTFDSEGEVRALASYPILAPTAPRRNVILITLNCWRWDHLSVAGYARRTTPFLEELHAAGKLESVRHTVGISN
ncbi:MAG: hypothetical protein J6386_03145 [Candidatus Synoicihabitans palmerolidicus]|nr:hypothetical protein [Candidatus Synoicihabitans palmerolidicus]